MTTLRPEIKAKWLAALRSGEFEQGQDVLRSGDKFCCWGVACELAHREGVVDHEADPVYGDDVWHRYGGARRLPPGDVYEWMGLDVDDSDYNDVFLFSFPFSMRGSSDTTTPQELNDSGFTFGQIADLIERFW